LTAHQLHDDEHPIALEADVADRNDVRVGQPGQRLASSASSNVSDGKMQGKRLLRRVFS
jgi:hypothetical protein